MKPLLPFSCCLLLLFAKTACSQSSPEACAWDRSIPLPGFLTTVSNKDVSLVVIGATGKSVFSFEVTDTIHYPRENGNGIHSRVGKIAKTDTNGIRKTWELTEVFGYDLLNDHRPDSVLKKLRPRVDLHLDKSTPVELICATEFRWVAKANIRKLKKCFTWYRSIAYSYPKSGTQVVRSYEVKALPYAHTRDWMIFRTTLTAPLGAHVDTVSGDVINFISGSDTIRFTERDLWDAGDDTSGIVRYRINGKGDTTCVMRQFNDVLYCDSFLVPMNWLAVISAPGMESSREEYSKEMAHPDSALMAAYPLLKTHRARYVTTRWLADEPENRQYMTSTILVLLPPPGKPGKIYVLLPYDCYKGIDFVIAETMYTGVAGQKRCMKIFKTFRF